MSQSNALLELITQWLAFTGRNPQGSVPEFAAWVISAQQQGGQEEEAVRQRRGLIGYQLGLLFRFTSIWEKKAFHDLPLRGFNEFGALSEVAERGFPRKTDVVKELMLEPSTGFEVIKKLVREGFLAEVTDSDDHRSVRLKITPLGRRVFAEVTLRVTELTRLLLGDLEERDLRELERVLQRLNQFHEGVYEEHRHSEWAAVRTATVQPE